MQWLWQENSESHGCGTHSSCCECADGWRSQGRNHDLRREDADLKRVLDGATVIAKKAGVSDPKTASVQSRDAARSIVVYAEDNDIDHIVVGTGGKGAVTRMMLGSVSSDIIGSCTLPRDRRKRGIAARLDVEA